MYSSTAVYSCSTFVHTCVSIYTGAYELPEAPDIHVYYISVSFLYLVMQADIFSLGTCLYELMSLRSLPPRDMTEAEYKNMLMMGKRAGFSTMVCTDLLCVCV